MHYMGFIYLINLFLYLFIYLWIEPQVLYIAGQLF